MKKTVRNIIILLVLLAVLGGAAFLLTNLPESGGDEDSSSSVSQSTDESQTMMDEDPANLKSLLVENAEDSFTIVPKSGGDSENPTFTLEGYEDYDINEAQISSNVRSLLGTIATKNIGEQSDLEPFGLGKDANKLTIEYKDGRTQILLLGNDAGESVGKYVLKDDEVYIAASMPTYFYGSKFAYFYNDIYEISDRVEVTIDDEGNENQTAAEDIMRTITFSGKHFPEPITINYNTRVVSLYTLSEPVIAESGTSAFQELVTSLKSLSGSGVVAAGITDELLEEYGLAEPDAQIEFNLNDSEHKLAVSAKDSEGNRFLIADDKDLIYKVTNEQVEKWAETELLKMRMSYVWLPNINNVNSLKVTIDGEEVHEFSIDRQVDEERSNDTSTQYILTITDGAGKDVSYSDAYQPFYQKILSLAVFSEEKAEYGGTPAVKVEYGYFEGGSDTVELYKMSEQNRYIAVLNGQFSGQIRANEVQAILDAVP